MRILNQGEKAQCRKNAFSALSSAAFEERENKDSFAADWWRMRASMWFRRSI